MRTCLKIMILLYATFFHIGINAQQHERWALYFHKANIIDTVFFQQLDSVLSTQKVEEHKYYAISLMKINEDDNSIEILLDGFETLQNEDLYIVKFNKRIYCVDKSLDGLVITKGKQFSINSDLKLVMEDFIKTFLHLIYKNKKIVVKADSRIDKYMLE